MNGKQPGNSVPYNLEEAIQRSKNELMTYYQKYGVTSRANPESENERQNSGTEAPPPVSVPPSPPEAPQAAMPEERILQEDRQRMEAEETVPISDPESALLQTDYGALTEGESVRRDILEIATGEKVFLPQDPQFEDDNPFDYTTIEQTPQNTTADISIDFPVTPASLHVETMSEAEARHLKPPFFQTDLNPESMERNSASVENAEPQDNILPKRGLRRQSSPPAISGDMLRQSQDLSAYQNELSTEDVAEIRIRIRQPEPENNIPLAFEPFENIREISKVPLDTGIAEEAPDLPASPAELVAEEAPDLPLPPAEPAEEEAPMFPMPFDPMLDTPEDDVPINRTPQAADEPLAEEAPDPSVPPTEFAAEGTPDLPVSPAEPAEEEAPISPMPFDPTLDTPEDDVPINRTPQAAEEPLAAANAPALPGETAIAFIEVQVFTARASLPVPRADVSITRVIENHLYLYGFLETDVSGKTEPISVPAPSPENSEIPGRQNPYSVYTITVSHPNFYTVEIDDTQIFPEIINIQPIELVPIAEDTKDPNPNIYNIPPHTLVGS